MESKTKLAFIGLGTMGSVLAENLLKAGYPVHVWNRTRSKAQRLLDLGAIEAKSPAEAASCAAIILYSLSGASAIETIVLGPHGIIEGVSEDKIIIDLGSSTPMLSQRLNKAFSLKRAHFLDAPVFGSVPEAKANGLWIMVGGDRNVYDRVRLLLEELATATYYMGSSGCGAATGLVGSLIVSLQLQALAEGLALAEVAGLDLSQVVEVISLPDFKSPIFAGMAGGVLERNFQPVFSLKNLKKDSDSIAEFASQHNLPLPTTALVRELIKMGVRKGWEEENASALLKSMEILASVKFQNKNNSPRVLEDITCHDTTNPTLDR